MKSAKLASLLAAVAFCTALPVSHATVWFHNTGTVSSGWDGTNLDPNCTIADSTSVAYKGTTAIKATATYNSGYSGRYHAMKTKNNVYRQGDTGFYGFAFYLQSTWDFSGSQQYHLFQFIADFTGASDNNCGEGWQPSTMVWVAGNKLNTRRNYGSGPCNRSTQSYTSLATVTAGVWHRVVIQASWQSNTTGFLKLWYDGTKVLEQFNIATTIDDTRYYRMDVGLYANSWHDQGTLVGSGNRQLWVDQIGTGSTFADADPAQW